METDREAHASRHARARPVPAAARATAGGAGVGRGLLREGQALRRAARHQGFFPVDLEHPDQLAQIVADLTELRRQIGRDLAEPYDVIAALPPRRDPEPYAAAGGTWWMVEFPWDAVSVDQVRGVIRDRPAAKAAPGG
jgi:hypothetical protein